MPLLFPLLRPHKPVTNPARKFKGDRDDRWHAGEDHTAKTGDLLIAPCHGEVRSQGWATRNGYKSRATVVSCYADATVMMAPTTMLVSEGEHVQAGQIVAAVDSYSGNDNATHVHLQVYSESYTAPLGKAKTQWKKSAQKPKALANPKSAFKTTVPGLLAGSIAAYIYG